MNQYDYAHPAYYHSPYGESASRGYQDPRPPYSTYEQQRTYASHPSRYDYDEDYARRDYDEPEERVSRPKRRSEMKPATLKEENLRKHNSASGSPARSRSRSRSPHSGQRNTIPNDQETVASSVGTAWRSIVTIGGTRRKVKSRIHPSRIPPSTGTQMALLIGVDDESQAASNSIGVVSQYLTELQFFIETVIDSGENSQQFEVDVEAGIAELIALAKPGDSIVLYAINYGPTGRHCAATLLHRLAMNMPSMVRITCIFDCCFLTAKPAFYMDHNQKKIWTARSAGLKHLRRLAKPQGTVAQKIAADIICFSGENPTGKTMVCRTVTGMVGIYTTALIRALRDEDIRKGVTGKTPSYSVIAAAIEKELSNIVVGSQPHNTKAEILCVKPYDIDQPCEL
jgi:hypothetical protein